MRLRPLLALSALALLVPALIVGCGGDNDEDPQTVIDETFSGDKTVDSGVLDLTVTGSAEGEQGGSVDASLSGPFQGTEGEFPQIDFTANVSAERDGQGIDFEGGVGATEEGAWVTYQGTDYEIPKEEFDEFKSQFEKQTAQAENDTNGATGAQLFEKAGVDPKTWLTNVENEGDADVEGTETIHISGDADVPKIIEDFSKLAEQVPGAEAQGIDPSQVREQLRAAEGAVSEATVNIYTGEEDKILRRLELAMTIAPPQQAAATGVDSFRLEFSATLSELNEEQTIEAPTDLQPLSDLAGQLGGLSGLGGLGGGTTPQIPGGGGGGTGGGAGGTGAPSQEYLDCVEGAQGPDEIAACAEQL